MNKETDLTRAEEAILGVLQRAGGQIVGRMQLLEALGDISKKRTGTFNGSYMSNVADVHIKNLRLKRPDTEIETIRGKGYRLV